MSTAFAAKIGDVIAINSVSATERGAKVNFLGTVAGVFVSQAWTDEDIAQAFDLSAPLYNASIIPVHVTPA